MELIGAEVSSNDDPERGSKLFKAFFDYLKAGDEDSRSWQEDYVDETIKEQSNEQQRLITKSEDAEKEEKMNCPVWKSRTNSISFTILSVFGQKLIHSRANICSMLILTRVLPTG